MGWEAETTVRCGSERASCRVLLESGEIIVRGALKRRFKFAAIQKPAVREQALVFRHAEEDVVINLGDRAADWLDAIRNPRTRVQKLGLKPGMSVCLMGPMEEGISDEVASATGSTPKVRLSKDSDVVLFFSDNVDQLERLARIETSLAEGGAVWVLWPKGRREIAHEHVVAAARAAGLVQTRSMGFSESRTGLRLVRSKAGKS